MKALVFAFLPCFLLAQQSSTSGPCSPIAPANSGTITINCPGLNAKQGDQILKILNKILSERLDADAVMKKLDEILHVVNPNLQVKVYFCNGQWRTSGPSATAGLEINMGGDDALFRRMAEMNNSGRYTELLSLSLEQLSSTPDWLTPYLFAGMSYFSAGNLTKAKEMLTTFDSKKGPAYESDGCKQMSDFLHARLP